MATFLLDNEDYIRHRVVIDRLTFKELSAEIKRNNDGIKGCGVQSLRYFCKEKQIFKSSRLHFDDVKEVVSDAVAKVFCSICNSGCHAWVTIRQYM